MRSISIIFSTFNDGNNELLAQSITMLQKHKSVLEIILVNYQADDSLQKFNSFSKVKIINSNFNSRAKRLDEGALIASGDTLLFHHPRSLLAKEAISELEKLPQHHKWGGFTHQFDRKNTFYNFTSWYSNNIRARIREIFYLDHCLFVNKDLYLLNPFSDAHIFEDTILSMKLRQNNHATLLKEVSTTSSIRFEKNGKLKQGFLNQILKICFYFNMDHLTMNKIYEFGLSLNSKY